MPKQKKEKCETCEEDLNGECYFCNKNMLSSPIESEGWREILNNSRITGHISGRHLILVSPKEDIYSDNEYDFLDDWFSRRLQDQRNKLIERVESIKEATREQTGSFKYDVCYDEVLELLKKDL